MAAWKLGSIFLLAVAGSGVVALLMNLALGRQFVGGNPAAAAAVPAAACHYSRRAGERSAPAAKASAGR
jgi:hypothetical protein